MRLQQKILIVDDDADIREVLNIQLTNEGYTVFESANGMEAVEAVAHNSDIDLVILDVMMPGMSGVGDVHGNPEAFLCSCSVSHRKIKGER